MEIKNRSGQALLIVLLAMAALSVVVLSVVSRSVSEVSTTTREEESLRAFSAAEAGVEEALVTAAVGETISKDLVVPSGSGPERVGTFTADVVRYPENPNEFAYPFELYSGQVASVWLVTREGNEILSCANGQCFSGNQMRVCWGRAGTNANTSQTPAIEFSLTYLQGGNYAVTRRGYDPYTVRRNAGVGGARPNNYSAPTGTSCQIDGQAYAFATDINLGSGGLGVPTVAGQMLVVRIKMLYNTATPHGIGVATTSGLPTQGKKVISEGSSGEATRRINAFLLNPEVPFMFDAALYSQGDIAK